MSEHRLVLRDIDIPDIEGITKYRSRGGYEGTRRALTEFSPQQTLEEVESSKLQGRGGSWSNVADKWRLMPPATGDVAPGERYLVVSGYEGDPGVFRDLKMMERLPHRLIDGAIIAAYALQAEVIYICLPAAMRRAVRALEVAVTEAREQGWLGRDIRGSGFDVDIRIHAGGNAHITGEETALLNSLEGRRPEPRPRPLIPTHHELFGRPALVHNAGTLAYLPDILVFGSAAFRQVGSRRCPGTLVLCVSGHVRRPGLYEVEIGSLTVRQLVKDLAGGMAAGSRLKAVLPGGLASQVLKPSELDVVLNPHELSGSGGADVVANSSFGNGAVVVMDETTCMVRTALTIMEFYAAESCGACTPCREGAPWLLDVLRRIEAGSGNSGDIDTIRSVTGQIAPPSGSPAMCGFAPAFATGVGGILSAFGSEFDDHIDGNHGCSFAAVEEIRVPESVHMRY